jgi:putative acetyltransferase
MSDYEVRRLVPADVPAMVSIIEAVRREYGVQRRIQSLLELSDRELFATYQLPRSDYFVAVHAGVPVGGAGIAPLAAGGDETCELQRMYLSAQHRGKGIGQLLLNQCLQRAAALQFRRCYAETVSEMKEAIRFYCANGFRQLSAPFGSSGHGHNDCWLMLDL